MHMTRRRLLSAAGGLGLARLALPLPAGAAAPLDGRSIKFILPSENGADAYARPFADWLRRALPGASISVQNEAAAGGKLAAKMLAENAGGDITIGLLSPGLMFAQMMGEDGVNYDFARFRFIGSMADDRRVLVVGKRTGIAKLDAMMGKPMVFGVNALSSSSAYDARILNAVLGLHLRIVPGFKTAERLKGIIAGELDAVGGSFASLHPIVESGDAVVVLRYTSAGLPEAQMKAPLLANLVKDGWRLRLAQFLEQQSRLGRLIAAAPAVGDADVAILRQAFDVITSDAAFRSEMAALEAPVDAESGASVESSILDMMLRSPALVADLKAALSCGQEISDGKQTSCEM